MRGVFGGVFGVLMVFIHVITGVGNYIGVYTAGNNGVQRVCV